MDKNGLGNRQTKQLINALCKVLNEVIFFFYILILNFSFYLSKNSPLRM